MEHLVTFIYGGEIQRLEENEGFKIIDNLINIFGFPKDLRQKCPIEQSDNWNFDTISIYDESEANTSDNDNDELPENMGSLEPTPTDDSEVEHSKAGFDQTFLEFLTKNQKEKDTSLLNNQNSERDMDMTEEEPFENIGSLEPSPTQKPKVEYSKSRFDQKFLEFLAKNQEEDTSLPNNKNIENEPMDITGSDANDYLFENIFSIAQSDEELEAGQSKTDLQGGP